MQDFTVVYETVREQFGLSYTEYALADKIHRLSGERSPVKGWCIAKKAKLAEMMSLSKTSIIGLTSKLVEKKIVRKNSTGRHLQTTEVWNKAIKTVKILVQNAHSKSQESCPFLENGQDSLPNESESYPHLVKKVDQKSQESCPNDTSPPSPDQQKVKKLDQKESRKLSKNGQDSLPPSNSNIDKYNLQVENKEKQAKEDLSPSSLSKNLKKEQSEQKEKEIARNLTEQSVNKRSEKKKDGDEKELEAEKVQIEPASKLPYPHQSEKFLDAWKQWSKHRKEKKATLTPTATRLQFKKLAALSEGDAVEMLLYSAEQGWTGLFAPKEKSNRKSNKPDTTIRDTYSQLQKVIDQEGLTPDDLFNIGNGKKLSA